MDNWKTEALNHPVDCIKGASSKAVETLIDLLEHVESESARPRYAIDLLNMVFKHIMFKEIEQKTRNLEGAIPDYKVFNSHKIP